MKLHIIPIQHPDFTRTRPRLCEDMQEIPLPFFSHLQNLRYIFNRGDIPGDRILRIGFHTCEWIISLIPPPLMPVPESLEVTDMPIGCLLWIMWRMGRLQYMRCIILSNYRGDLLQREITSDPLYELGIVMKFFRYRSRLHPCGAIFKILFRGLREHQNVLTFLWLVFDLCLEPLFLFGHPCFGLCFRSKARLCVLLVLKLDLRPVSPLPSPHIRNYRHSPPPYPDAINQKSK